jgi:hypothetical protein
LFHTRADRVGVEPTTDGLKENRHRRPSRTNFEDGAGFRRHCSTVELPVTKLHASGWIRTNVLQLRIDNHQPAARCRTRSGDGLACANALPLSYRYMQSTRQESHLRPRGSGPRALLLSYAKKNVWATGLESNQLPPGPDNHLFDGPLGQRLKDGQACASWCSTSELPVTYRASIWSRTDHPPSAARCRARSDKGIDAPEVSCRCVGVSGLEPPASRSRTERSAKLSYTPRCCESRVNALARKCRVERPEMTPAAITPHGGPRRSADEARRLGIEPS